jgi:dTDP-4-dehydrorhamnose reductase
LESTHSIRSALDKSRPDVVLHLAAISAAEAVRREPARAWAINVDATRVIADWCGEQGRRMVFTSTDLVFDGQHPWRKEEDPADPILEYGRTKRLAEPFVTAIDRGLVARVSLLYGPSRCGRVAYFDKTMEALRRREPQTMFEDEFRTPLDFLSAARALVGLAQSHLTGIVHVAGRERMSRHELILRSARVLGFDESLVRANRRKDALLAEPRPADVSLDTDKLALALPDLERPCVEVALSRMLDRVV